jgi:hypothetical protein
LRIREDIVGTRNRWSVMMTMIRCVVVVDVQSSDVESFLARRERYEQHNDSIDSNSENEQTSR